MPDVLPVAAFEIGDPVAVFVLMETGDALVHGVCLTFSFRHPRQKELDPRLTMSGTDPGFFFFVQ